MVQANELYEWRLHPYMNHLQVGLGSLFFAYFVLCVVLAVIVSLCFCGWVVCFVCVSLLSPFLYQSFFQVKVHREDKQWKNVMYGEQFPPSRSLPAFPTDGEDLSTCDFSVACVSR